MKYSQKTIDRFNGLWMPEPNSGCWLYICVRKYGSFWANGKANQAHRVSYEIHKGPVPDHLQVCHKCDTPRCVNPDHLFLGTASENAKDMVSKGRMHTNFAKGLTHYKARLKAKDIINIRKLRAEGMKHTEIAQAYSVSTGTIARILRGERWSHIK